MEMNPIVGNSSKSKDSIRPPEQCALCNKVATSQQNFMSKNSFAESVLNTFIGGCGHDENCHWPLCPVCTSLCLKLSQTRQVLSNLIDDITSHLLRSHHKITFLLPKKRIITKLFEAEPNLVDDQDQKEESIAFNINAEEFSALCTDTAQKHEVLPNDIDNVVSSVSLETSSTEKRDLHDDDSLLDIGALADDDSGEFMLSATGSTLKKGHMVMKNPKRSVILKKTVLAAGKKVDKAQKYQLKLSTKSNSSGTSQRRLKKTYPCTMCGKHCRSPKDLDTHIGSHLKEKKFVCEICGVAYRQKRALEVHVGLHRGEAKFECEHCGKAFTQKAGLQRHLPIHTGESQFQCEECGKRFLHHTSFALHKKIHIGQRQFSCEVCNQRFYARSHLRRHINSHMGVKPHKCTVCSKTFAERYNLVAHMTIHTGKKKFNCAICEVGFNRKHGLTQHVVTMHKEVKIEVEDNDNDYIAVN